MKTTRLFLLRFLIAGFISPLTAAILTVDTPDDVTEAFDGRTSLREAIAAAGHDDIVNFDPVLSGKTILLSEGEIFINKAVTIESGLIELITIASAELNPTRLFFIWNSGSIVATKIHFSAGSTATNGGAIWNDGQLILHSCRFSDNTAAEEGGAIYNQGGAVTLNSCLLEGNTAGRGGAVSNVGNASLGANDCLFEGNEALGLAGQHSGGGAVFAEESDTYLARCRLLGNSSGGYGFALATENGGIFRVRNSVIAGSFGIGDPVQDNAAVSAYFTDLSMRDCAVLGTRGGGFNGTGGGWQNALSNCTFSGNDSSAIVVSDTQVELENCLVWNNSFKNNVNHSTASIYLDPDSIGVSTATYSHSLIQGKDLTGVGTGNLDGTDSANDPGFALPVDPAEAPTVTGDLTPSLTAALVNRGDLAAASGNNDAAGNPRVVWGGIDLGAYEVQQKVILVDESAAEEGADGMSWATAFPTLSQGFVVAGGGDIFRVAAGLYSPDLGPGRVAGDASEHFCADFSFTMEGGYPAGGGERDLENEVTVITGDLGRDDQHSLGVTGDAAGIRGTNAWALLVVDPGEDGEVVLDGLILTGADASEELSGSLGALMARSGQLEIRDCRVVGNLRGLTISNTELSFERCEISGNSGLGEVATFVDSRVYYFNSRITGNSRRFKHKRGVLVVNNLVLVGNLSGLRLIETNANIINLTAASNADHAIDAVGSVAVSFANCVIWRNETQGRTPRSIDLGPDIFANFSHCLVQHHDLRETGEENFDGTDLMNNPAFVEPFAPFYAPHSSGRYELSSGSPGIDAGKGEVNLRQTDVNGLPRVQEDVINLGAYEEVFAPSDSDFDGLPDYWESEFNDEGNSESIDPAADDDGDGFANLVEFVHALHPFQPNSESEARRLMVVEDEGTQYLALTYRNNPAASVSYSNSVERSQDLGLNSPWTSAGMLVDGHPSRDQEVTYRSPDAIESHPKDFLRLSISRVNF